MELEETEERIGCDGFGDEDAWAEPASEAPVGGGTAERELSIAVVLAA